MYKWRQTGFSGQRGERLIGPSPNRTVWACLLRIILHYYHLPTNDWAVKLLRQTGIITWRVWSRDFFPRIPWRRAASICSRNGKSRMVESKSVECRWLLSTVGVQRREKSMLASWRSWKNHLGKFLKITKPQASPQNWWIRISGGWP